LDKTAIKRAVILAAGRGTRMGEMTSDTPKTMLPVRGRPMLEHVLDGLASVGVERFFLVVGYRREMIEEYFANWRRPIEFRVQEQLDGTGSATRLAREFATEPFFLTFGDILCEPADYVRCGRVLDEHPATVAVLGVKYVEDPWQGAAVYVDEDHRVTKVVEKPPIGTSTTHWNSAGLYTMRPGVFPYLDRLQPSARGEYELTSIFDMLLEEKVEMRISPIEGRWRDVGRPEDLAAVNE
jgi:UDP-N-acetylglucosamine diphosphorylase / glucose-1-phosphate thymidylyltransferase / UDP-N-acetylgalactosamine diphosphorylase / glucosamine-1-phosphate N-acetyltransferase / galactosamine-1-phosphate N-acetyltransferase